MIKVFLFEKFLIELCLLCFVGFLGEKPVGYDGSTQRESEYKR
jgi:hypothetical protein